MVTKKCKGCLNVLLIENFTKSKLVSDGYENKCKQCRKIAREKFAKQKQAKILSGSIIIKNKTCTMCKETKDIINFSKDKSRSDGFETSCKDCKKKSYKKYSSVHENKIKISNRSKNWRANNKERQKNYAARYYLLNKEKITKRISKYQNTKYGKYRSFKIQAKSRNIINSLAYEEYNNLIDKPCFYCGDKNLPNGVDRVDSSEGYSSDNCVPCCSKCNYGKNTLSVDDFIKHICAIIDYQEGGVPEDRIPVINFTGNPKNDHYLTPFGRYSQYKSNAKQRKIDFNLTQEEFFEYWQKNCTYCGKVIDTIGLDRIDSSLGYSVDNIVPCCMTCNNVKHTISTEEFIEHCYKIKEYFNND